MKLFRSGERLRNCSPETKKEKNEEDQVSAAGEFAPEVRINGIAPGIVAQVDCPAEGVHAQVKEAEIPMRRFTESAEIAKIAGSMLFDWPTYTGQVMTVDGGLTTSIPLHG